MKKTTAIEKHKNDITDFFLSFKPEFFITLVFRSNIKRETAYKSMTCFINKMNNRFFIRKAKKQIRILPVLEMGRARYGYDSCDLDKVEANWHIHLIIENPIKRDSRVSEVDLEELKELIGNLWENTPHGDVNFTTRHYQSEWFKPIHNIEGLSSYLNKETNTGNKLAVCYEKADNTGIKPGKHKFLSFQTPDKNETRTTFSFLKR